MLQQLTIKNFLLIEYIDIEFSRGLNILTGQTGGGKTLVLKALDFLLGARASSDLVFSDRDSAEVSAVFNVSGPIAETLEQEKGIQIGEDSVLIMRRVYREHKGNLCYMNSSPVLVNDLKWAGDKLVDYLAQDHKLLLQKRQQQLDILDSFCGNSSILNNYSEALSEYKDIHKRYTKSCEQKEHIRDMLETAEFEHQELNALDPEPGEDVRLKKEIALREHFKELAESFGKGVFELYEKESSAYDILSEMERVISKVSDSPEELASLGKEINDAMTIVSALVDSLRRYSDEALSESVSLEQIQERYYELQDMKNKFNMTLDELLHYRDELPGKIEEYSGSINRSSELKEKMEQCWSKVMALGEKLREARKKGAPEFETGLKATLQKLGLEQSRFTVNITEKDLEPDNAGWSGFDSVDFLFSANPGVDMKFLGDIASGGELSRIMLAVQSIIGKESDDQILVFDEIDAEIGGRMGHTIGNMMKMISEQQQVICITHLPQLACFGNSHFKIEKKVRSNKTFVEISSLCGAERVRELAHMLRGDSYEDENTINEVECMLERAQNV